MYITDEKIDMLVSKLVMIYTATEMEIILKFARLLKSYNGEGGTLDWYRKMLEQMGVFNNECRKLIAKLSMLSVDELEILLERCQEGCFDFDSLNKAFERRMIDIKPSELITHKPFRAILSTNFEGANKQLRLIQTKAQQSINATYLDIINKAYVQSASGYKSYSQSIDEAIRNMCDKGFTRVSYDSGRTYSIESAVRREVVSHINKMQNETANIEAQELGTEFVEVSSHLGARTTNKMDYTNHAHWQGKVYHRGGEIDYNGVHYLDFEKETGYGVIEGLGGVNCRHRFFPFFPDFSTPSAVQFDYEENKKLYEATQQQRALERDIRRYKKRYLTFKELYGADNENTIKANKKLKELQAEIKEHCRKNDLKRDYNRERVSEQL